MRTDVRQEAHVEHVVGLVEHQAVHAAQVEQDPAPEQIEHAARAADHDLRTLRAELTWRTLGRRRRSRPA
jgi:hypothetical protein